MMDILVRQLRHIAIPMTVCLYKKCGCNSVNFKCTRIFIYSVIYYLVKINIIDSGKNSFPILTGAALHGEYTLDNVHFHWHSEHTIDGKRYPLEAHFVHYKMLYGSMREAINYPDGVIVLGVMFKMADCGSEELNSVVYTTWKVNMPKTKTELSSFDPYSILPGDKKSYYKYSGSLTTPECNEGVTWIVFENPVPLSEEQ
ncbi:hypothetical protein NQ315_015425, partial [Exocentrus adspersus]